MGLKDNSIRIHRELLLKQADKVKVVIHIISGKDSLNEKDTQAIRALTEVYDVLFNSEKENHRLRQEVDKNRCL